MILIMTVLVFLGGLAWLTRHPDAEILHRAESWPLVGSLASEFRQSYGVSAPERTTESEGAAEEPPKFVEPVVSPLGEGFVWVAPGTILRRGPDESSKKILQFDAITNVTRLEKKGDWYRVWFRGREGWVYLEGYSDEKPPYGSDPLPTLPLPSQEPEEEALAAARSYLGERERHLVVGPYRLYTDSPDDVLLAYLGRLASGLEEVYVERLGMRPVDGNPKEVVVIYRQEQHYRQLQNSSDQLVGLLARGHTGSGLVVLYVGARARWEVGSTLIHELVHTLNRRTLGPALPSWLDEGLAEDLSLSASDDAGKIQLGSLGGERRRESSQITVHGGVASLWALRDRAREGRLPKIPALLHLEWADFVRAEAVTTHYAAAAFWIRFLLAGDQERLAEPFREYLRGVSRGESATPEVLRLGLDLPWNVLDARYQLWIDFQRPAIHLVEPDSPMAFSSNN